MSDVMLREMTYSNCGQEAWAVEHKGEILFYLIKAPGQRWFARESLGRGYRCGAYSIPFGVREVTAKRLETAKKKVFMALADAFEAQAYELLDQETLLHEAAQR